VLSLPPHARKRHAVSVNAVTVSAPVAWVIVGMTRWLGFTVSVAATPLGHRFLAVFVTTTAKREITVRLGRSRLLWCKLANRSPAIHGRSFCHVAQAAGSYTCNHRRNGRYVCPAVTGLGALPGCVVIRGGRHGGGVQPGKGRAALVTVPGAVFVRTEKVEPLSDVVVAGMGL